MSALEARLLTAAFDALEAARAPRPRPDAPLDGAGVSHQVDERVICADDMRYCVRCCRELDVLDLVMTDCPGVAAA